MASTNSTANLHLNQWVGTDKPKMEDFNTDNSKIDAAVGAHIASTAEHVSATERSGWNNAMPVIGTYTGSGQPERLIELGFRPSFGIVFAINKNIVQTVGTTGNMAVFSAFISAQGCSQGAIVEEVGFRVLSVAPVMFNRIAMLNEANVPYVYIMFR
ncbi:hypothetical protein V6615_05720 [Oscillospiraceae bacterium PP1C4]